MRKRKRHMQLACGCQQHSNVEMEKVLLHVALMSLAAKPAT